MRDFFSDTEAVDTIPLKLVVYLALLAATLFLTLHAWQTVNPALEDAEIKSQVETASLSILSIQHGYARNSVDNHSSSGSICTLEFSLPASVRYLSFGVDPDPECNGQLNDSEWSMENNTLLYQYKNGVKNRIFLEGKPVHFIKGYRNSGGIWTPMVNQENNETNSSLERIGVVIEYPVSGEYIFEMVTQDGRKYTMSHF
ncbi:MAG TPA: hypothetical protein VN278_07175 [Methanosarcina sp.]|nr:hypothetical protein [Methanosarcina sp.]